MCYNRIVVRDDLLHTKYIQEVRQMKAIKVWAEDRGVGIGHIFYELPVDGDITLGELKELKEKIGVRLTATVIRKEVA